MATPTPTKNCELSFRLKIRKEAEPKILKLCAQETVSCLAALGKGGRAFPQSRSVREKRINLTLKNITKKTLPVSSCLSKLKSIVDRRIFLIQKTLTE